MDLGTDLGEQGFRWIFIVNSHLGLSHNRMLNQAGDYFRDTYGGHMVNLAALIYRPPGQSQTRSEEEQREDGDRPMPARARQACSSTFGPNW
jgi:hypothetical protein